ncbi:TonB-dependent receptor [Mucilaginibacter sp. HMF5004]|uniref:TonB-dependent receptor n=1 Tax=Mucilaginibacter rivuli TaxID=2857527 RepID=UPI001C5E3D51|nr:TonB-dependent receptor [Mucilaginibacter rivuli]MBW4888651.1 TonB-dependent receptor [Mucilaginibacter rivuli]
MRTVVLFALFSLVALSSIAQKKLTISGTLKDEATGEQLIGATVKIKEIPQSGTITNSYGFYSISAPAGDYTLLYTYVGYQTVTRQVSLHQNQSINIALPVKSSLKEVVINVNRPNNDNIASPQMGVEKLNMAQINNVPVLMGEKDILKTISLLPGVKAASEGNTGFYIRGGSSNQNLILLDEATVYNASHLFGFFSTFNSDAIKDVSLYKGGMPAEYGGRLSSVLDIKMNEGNNQKFTVQGGLGLISSRLKIEGPLVKDKGSFMVSARRTYIDLFLGASSDTTIKGSTLYFYDLNAKANYHFNDKNAIYLSGYFGKDILGLKNTFGTEWGNATGTVRFNHIFSNKLFSNTSLIFSNYSYTIQSFSNTNDFKATSQITDVNFKEDLQYSISDSHSLKFGVNVLHHTIAPGEISSSQSSSINTRSIEDRYGYEIAAYISDEWKATDKLTLLYGLRLSDMFLQGPGTFKTYDAAGNTATSNTYNSGAVVQSYVNLEPRLSAGYAFNDENSVKLSYNRNTQNVHLISNSTSSTPTDLYVMSSNNIKPEIADQVATGFFKNFKDNTYEFSAEVYYKWMQNQIDYKDGAQLIANQDVESQLTYGSGRAYGIELFLKKKYGRFNGWIGYTLSRTELQFAAINKGNYYPARQDRTHDLSVVGIFELNKRWTFSGTFIYGTGNAVTYPTGKYNIGGLTTFSFSERNGYRQPATNRLDIGATLEGKEHKKYHSSWTFGIYNVYGYKNPYVITFRDSKTTPNTTEAVQTSIFGSAIPSVTWNFKF